MVEGWAGHMKNIAILNSADMPIPLHAYAAMSAVLLGGIQLILKKGTPLHRFTGRIWVGLIAIVAISSFFISEIQQFGPFSLIHALSVFVLWSIWAGVRAARAGDFKRHKKIMVSLYGLGLMLTGMFTFLPGRTMYLVFFGT